MTSSLVSQVVNIEDALDVELWNGIVGCIGYYLRYVQERAYWISPL